MSKSSIGVECKNLEESRLLNFLFNKLGRHWNSGDKYNIFNTHWSNFSTVYGLNGKLGKEQDYQEVLTVEQYIEKYHLEDLKAQYESFFNDTVVKEKETNYQRYKTNIAALLNNVYAEELTEYGFPSEILTMNLSDIIEWLDSVAATNINPSSKEKELDHSQHKLTKREHGFLEYAENGYIFRNEYGMLVWANCVPKEEEKEYVSYDVNYKYIDENIFSFIEWENEEPYSVKEMLTWEVEE